MPDGAFAGHWQAEPDVRALRAAMRAAVADPAAAAARGAAAREDMVRKYSPAVVGALIKRHLDRLGGPGGVSVSDSDTKEL